MCGKWVTPDSRMLSLLIDAMITRHETRRGKLRNGGQGWRERATISHGGCKVVRHAFVHVNFEEPSAHCKKSRRPLPLTPATFGTSQKALYCKLHVMQRFSKGRLRGYLLETETKNAMPLTRGPFLKVSTARFWGQFNFYQVQQTQIK